MARILVIEDNAENLELMGYLLRAFGHEVLATVDGYAGLEMTKRERPDLIVCDIHLPILDGYEVVRRIKADSELQAIPVVAVTALAMVGDRERGVAAGFDGYLYKPIDPQSFIHDLERYLHPDRRGVTPPLVSSIEVAPTVRPVATAGTILTVDDSPVNHDLLRHLLEPFGYEVRLAAGVEDGLAQAGEKVPDLILSDLHMPHQDGFALLRRIKTIPEFANIPVVVISSTAWGEQDRVIATQLGAARFFLRPVEPTILLNEIIAILASSQG